MPPSNRGHQRGLNDSQPRRPSLGRKPRTTRIGHNPRGAHYHMISHLDSDPVSISSDHMFCCSCYLRRRTLFRCPRMLAGRNMFRPAILRAPATTRLEQRWVMESRRPRGRKRPRDQVRSCKLGDRLLVWLSRHANRTSTGPQKWTGERGSSRSRRQRTSIIPRRLSEISTKALPFERRVRVDVPASAGLGLLSCRSTNLVQSLGSTTGGAAAR